MQVSPGNPTSTPKTYALLNAFVDNGWLGKLTPMPQSVWLAYLRHANAEGESWPSPTRVARYLNHKHPEHVRQARRLLVKLGLLVPVDRGGGRRSGKFRVAVPAPDESVVISKPLGSDSDLGPVQAGEPSPHPLWLQAPTSTPHPNPMPTPEGLLERTQQDDEPSEKECCRAAADVRKLREALAEHGIWPSVAERLIDEFPNLTARTVRYLARRLDKNTRNRGAALARHIRNEAAHLNALDQKAAEAERGERLARVIKSAVREYESHKDWYEERAREVALEGGLDLAVDQVVRTALYRGRRPMPPDRGRPRRSTPTTHGAPILLRKMIRQKMLADGVSFPTPAALASSNL